jgi:hypothetical protein
VTESQQLLAPVLEILMKVLDEEQCLRSIVRPRRRLTMVAHLLSEDEAVLILAGA